MFVTNHVKVGGMFVKFVMFIFMLGACQGRVQVMMMMKVVLVGFWVVLLTLFLLLLVNLHLLLKLASHFLAIYIIMFENYVDSPHPFYVLPSYADYGFRFILFFL